MKQKQTTCLKITATFALFTALIGCGPGGGFHQLDAGAAPPGDVPKIATFYNFDETPSPTATPNTKSNVQPQSSSSPAVTGASQQIPVQQKSDNLPQDVTSAGVAKPTIYYFPIIKEDEEYCIRKETITGKTGVVLAQVCRKTFNECALQGSCAVVQNSKFRSFNIIGRFNGKDRFFETTNATCKFGFGIKSMCLDPFYTVAADLKFHKPGDVIFIPVLRGIELPNGTKHDGYLIVRDVGRAIKGSGRFDFFSGYLSWKDHNNPFAKIGLGDSSKRFRYYKIQGATAKAVLSHRQFPGLPMNEVDVLQVLL